MYTPVNPSFTILKWGLRGSKLYRHVFVMLKFNSVNRKDTFTNIHTAMPDELQISINLEMCPFYPKYLDRQVGALEGMYNIAY